LFYDSLREVEQEPRVEILKGARIEEISGEAGNFSARVSVDSGDGQRELTVGAIVVAVGFEPFDAKLKGEFGYGQYPAVITALEAERMLREKGRVVTAAGTEPKRVSFIQCVGSRDVSLGKPYCSRICCAYAMRMAAVLRHDFPECEVTIFYMDFQPQGKKFEAIRAGLVADGRVRLLMSMPAKIYGWEGEEGVEVRYVDPSTGGLTMEHFDLVVLSIGLGGPTAPGFLADLGRTEDGFLGGNGKQGVFCAGSCSGPRTIAESISEGRITALRVATWLRSR
jgi:heterodisulfide reductase subunit A